MILFNGEPIPFGMFPNGETLIPKPFFTQHWKVSNVVTLKYEGDDDLFKLLLVRKALWFPCTLEITYFPYSRMDRNSEEYIFTLKSVAKYINWLEWTNVIVYEPHSDVTPALLNHCKSVYLVPKLLAKLLTTIPNGMFGVDPFQLFYPDAGAQKRYNLTSPELIGFKKRDFKTGKITEYQIFGEREPSIDHVIIVDDLCSKGGTFVLAAEKLRAMGFTHIDLVVGHCEETIFEGKLFSTDLVDHVWTTDSIIKDNRNESKLTVIPIKELA